MGCLEERMHDEQAEHESQLADMAQEQAQRLDWTEADWKQYGEEIAFENWQADQGELLETPAGQCGTTDLF